MIRISVACLLALLRCWKMLEAISNFQGLKAAHVASEGGCGEEFAAYRSCFSRFKVRANLHNIKVQGEATSGDGSVASDFPVM